MTTTLMWEARAAEGRGAELLDWVRGQKLDPAPVRRETFTAAADRVLVITWWDTDGPIAELPEPPAGLLHRPVHRWRFQRVPE
ncbi:hypothetical protein N0X72_11320 [Streptomyces carpaticus]|nr:MULTISPECIES: hypothetical protein [Streptomyces]QKV68898.1 hypothetical protein HUT13_08945 [Streptomyces harbinensis]UWM49559.1 hypothetical protein N0X72_11320 [Streptomyces carpaticus]